MSSIAFHGRRVSLAIALLTVAAVSAPAQSLAYVGGAQYATGDFVFTERTWSAYLLTGPRVIYAMAVAGQFPAVAGRLTSRAGTPGMPSFAPRSAPDPGNT